MSKCKAKIPSLCRHHGFPLRKGRYDSLKWDVERTKSVLKDAKKKYEEVEKQFQASNLQYTQESIIQRVRTSSGGGILLYDNLSANVIEAETFQDLTDEGYAILETKVNAGKANEEQLERFEVATEMRALFNVVQETFYNRRAAENDTLWGDLFDSLSKGDSFRIFAETEVEKLEHYKKKNLISYKHEYGEFETNDYGMKTGKSYRYAVATEKVCKDLISQIQNSVNYYEKSVRKSKFLSEKDYF